MKIDLDAEELNKSARLSDLEGHIFVEKSERHDQICPYILARTGYEECKLISLLDGNRYSDTAVTVEDLQAWDDVTELVKVAHEWRS